MITIKHDLPQFAPEIEYTLGVVMSALQLPYRFVGPEEHAMLNYTAEVPSVGAWLGSSDFFRDVYSKKRTVGLPVTAADGIADYVASIFVALTGYENLCCERRDKWGRFSANDSLLVQAGLLHTPVVDSQWIPQIEYRLREHFPSLPKIRRDRWSVCLTHDMDHLLLRPARWSLQAKRDPYLERIKKEDNRVGKATYFFRADGDTAVTLPEVQVVAKTLAQGGHEVGLHGGFGAATDADVLHEQKTAFRRSLNGIALRNGQQGIRNHYLLWEPQTWALQVAEGIAYDSTLSYHDRAGFRCGTCRPFHPFDIEARRALPIWEVPLTVMDCSLNFYEGLDMRKAADKVGRLMWEVKDVGGVFVVLVHNTWLAENPEWIGLYKFILEKVREGRAKCMRMGDAVRAWEADHAV